MATTVSPRLLVGILLSWLGSQVERFIGCDPEWRGDRFISELIEGERIGQTKTEQVRAHFDLLSGFTHVTPYGNCPMTKPCLHFAVGALSLVNARGGIAPDSNHSAHSKSLNL